METPTLPERTLIGLRSDDPCEIPNGKDFIEGDYLEGKVLARIGEAIIDRYPRFDQLIETDFGEVRIRYLWVKGEKRSGGHIVLGWCQKANGMTKWFTGVDYVIGIQAEALQLFNFTNLQLEALIFHELCHIRVEIKKGELKYGSVGHDQEIFHDEVRYYGLWLPSLEETDQAFKQMPLSSGGRSDDDLHEESRPEPPTPLQAARELRDAVERTGTTMTMTVGDTSATIRPSTRTINGETFHVDDLGRYVSDETGEILDPIEVPRASAIGG